MTLLLSNPTSEILISEASTSIATINQLLDQLGIDLDQKTDLELLNTILCDTMRLDDLISLTAILGSKLTIKQSLRPMLDSIKHALLKNPVIVACIKIALQRNLIPRIHDKHGQSYVKKVLHHSFLLDALTKAMADNINLMEEIKLHLLNKREALDLVSEKNILKATQHGFSATKAKFIDKAMNSYSKIRKQNYFLPEDIQLSHEGIQLNILEAALTEKINGFQDNSSAGIILTKRTFDAIQVTGENRILEIDLPMDWVRLYTSWNFAFILSSLKYPFLTMPKLLIPQVIAASPNNFMFNRTLALWLTVNFYLFTEINNPVSTIHPQCRVLAALWGKMNYRYAQNVSSKWDINLA